MASRRAAGRPCVPAAADEQTSPSWVDEDVTRVQACATAVSRDAMVWFTVAVCLGLVAAPLALPSAAAPRQKSNPYFHTCRYRARYWDDCVQTVAQELQPLFAEGVPELGVRPIDPLFVDTFNFSEVSGKFRVHLVMNNVTMEGLSDYYVTGVRSNLQELSMEIRLRVPSLSFRAHYHMDGRFLFLALSGGGTCQYNFTDVDNKVVVRGHLVRRVSDDALHFRVNTLQWTMLPSKGFSQFSAQEGDSSVYSHATSRLLNDHGEEGWRSFQSAAELAFAEVFRERINRLMMNIPYRDLFPPGVLPLHLLELPMADNVADEYPPLYWTRPSTTTTTTTTSTTTTESPSTTSTTTSPPATISPPVTTAPFIPTQNREEPSQDTAQVDQNEQPAAELVDDVQEAVTAVEDILVSREEAADSATGPEVVQSSPPVEVTLPYADQDAEQPERTRVLEEAIGSQHNGTVRVASENVAAAAVAGAAVAADEAAAGGDGADQPVRPSGANQNLEQEGASAAAAGAAGAAGAVPRQDEQDPQDAARPVEGVNGVVKEEESGQLGERPGDAPPRPDLEDADTEDRIASFDTAFTLEDEPGTPPTPSVLPVDVYIGDAPASRREEYTVVDSDGTAAGLSRPEAPESSEDGRWGVVSRVVAVDSATTADTITPREHEGPAAAARQMHQVWSPTEGPEAPPGSSDEIAVRERTEPSDVAPTSASTDAAAMDEATEADNSIPDEDDDDQLLPLPLASRGERAEPKASQAASDAAGNTTTTMPAEDFSPLASLGQVVSAVAKDLIAEVSEVFIGPGVGAEEEVAAGEATTSVSPRG
ncbi:Protein takeout [Frankliniella fusca]|uniref:Protein takeout n=1 Tax=Frankliniella fusca TaxID=407009 RepID=A0AAE1LQN3_9NEOP|nr:Protein takeout [Frankliniella fusca]